MLESRESGSTSLPAEVSVLGDMVDPGSEFDVHPPAARRSRQALWLGAALMLLTLAVAVGFVWIEANRQRTTAMTSVALHAKVLEDHTTRMLNSAEAVMGLVLDVLDSNDPARTDLDRLSTVLQEGVRRQPFLRSLSVLDPSGRVVASSQASNLGVRVPLELLGSPREPGPVVRIAPVLGGRDLHEARALLPEGVGGAAVPVHGLPLVRPTRTSPEAPPWLIVALVNPDHFATEQDRLLADSGLQALLVSDSGQLVAGPPQFAPGSKVSGLKVFTEFLPNREAGAYIGVGVAGDEAVTGFKASRRWPAVVLVELPYAQVRSRIIDTAGITAGLTAFILLLISVALWAIHRSLRNDEQYQHRTQTLFSAARSIESRRRAILEASVDAIITIDLSGAVIDFNKAAEIIFRRTKLEMVQRDMAEFLLPPHERDGFRQRLADATAGHTSFGPSQRLEMDGMRADGSVFPIELTMVRVKSGLQRYFTATLRDITEQREVERERASLLARYQRLAVDLERQKLALDEHAIVSIADPFGRITYANAKLVEVSGYSLGDLIGQKHSVLKSGRQGAEVYQNLWRTITRGAIWHGELVNRRRDGSLYWVACTIVPVPGEDKLPRQYISIQTDISALRQAEQALAHAHARELEIGARIQQSLLVTQPNQATPGLWISAYNQASQGIDGDFFEVIQLGEHCVDIIVGDVMGKGLAAALMGAATKLQFSRSLAELVSRRDVALPEPSEVVGAVHAAMTPHLQALEAFVTLCYLRVDTRAGLLTWVGCGHEEPVLLGQQDQVRRLENQHPPLGVLDLPHFEQDRCEFQAGDAFFLLSDGVTDAVRPDGSRIGRDRPALAFRQLVRRHSTPAAVLHSLRKVLLHEGVQTHDDVTMVTVMLVPDGQHRRRLELPVDLGALAPAREFTESHCQAAGLPEETVALLTVAVVEVITNVVRHSQNRLAGSALELVFSRTAEEVVLEIIHLGDAFDPSQREPVETDFSSFPEGGFGLSIIQGASDTVQYLHSGGVNTVRLSRRLPT